MMNEFWKTVTIFKTFFCFFQVCYQFEYQDEQMSLKKITWQKKYRWWPFRKLETQLNELDLEIALADKVN